MLNFAMYFIFSDRYLTILQHSINNKTTMSIKNFSGKGKRILNWLAGILAVCLVVVGGGSVYLVDYALASDPDSRPSHFEKMTMNYPELRPWLDSLNAHNSLRHTFLVMPDTKLRSHCIYIPAPHPTANTAMLIHGYTNNATDMLHIARLYNVYMGYNVIMPGLHGHGLSDGDDIQMGWKDRLDILQWIKSTPLILNIPRDSMRMVVHGVSMGAATTMCVSGEKTPESVRCFVEDCGYTSAWDEFEHELKNRFSLPAFPLLYTSSWLTKLKYGWSFKEASPLKQVAKCHKPMLFIHGSNDTFVPTWMVYPLYKAKPGVKELWVAPGSAHAMAYHDHKKEYTQKVTKFVGKHMAL